MSLIITLTVFLSVLLPVYGHAAEVNCLDCHEELSKGKVVHAAVQMGCVGCHSGIDASDVPHVKKNKLPRGLSAEQPDLCFGCHDKAKFTGRNIHAPVGIGMCTDCHSPHKSDFPKLLLKEQPELCYKCHDKKLFSKKNVHAPVEGGMCLDCHKPHASEHFTLLVKEPVNVCFECHAQVRKTPHAIVGMLQSGHPLGVPKKGKRPVDDPARPGKRFYCGSCHNPHSSDYQYLFRYEARSGMELCLQCHKK